MHRKKKATGDKSHDICTVEEVIDDKSNEICTVEKVIDDKSYEICTIEKIVTTSHTKYVHTKK